MSEVNADLMGASGERLTVHFTEGAAIVRPATQAAEASKTHAPLWMHRALQPDRTRLHEALTDDRLIHIDLVPTRMTVDDGEIFFFRHAVLQAHRERARGLCVFRHQNEAARFAIKPCDDGGLVTVRHFEREQTLQPAE